MSNVWTGSCGVVSPACASMLYKSCFLAPPTHNQLPRVRSYWPDVLEPSSLCWKSCSYCGLSHRLYHSNLQVQQRGQGLLRIRNCRQEAPWADVAPGAPDIGIVLVHVFLTGRGALQSSWGEVFRRRLHTPFPIFVLSIANNEVFTYLFI